MAVAASNATAEGPDATPSQAAIAEGLFQEGKTLLADGNVSQACAKFSESLRIEPALGTLLNLAVCHEREGKTASAWSEYSDAVALAERTGESERAQFARSRLDAVRVNVPHLVVRLSAGEDSTEVTLDGQVLGSGAFDTAIPLNPGQHRLQAAARGRVPWSASIDVEQGAAAYAMVVPKLRPEYELETPLRAPLGPNHGRASALHSADAVDAVNLRRRWGLVSGGVGALGIGVGAFWGIRVFSKQRIVEQHCSPAGCRDQVGEAADRDAHRAATWADISFGTGLLACAVSAYLLLTSRSHPGLSVTAYPTLSGIHASASF